MKLTLLCLVISILVKRSLPHFFLKDGDFVRELPKLIVVKVAVHYDVVLAQRLVTNYSWKGRGAFRVHTKNLLRDVQDLFNDGIMLKVKLDLKLVNAAKLVKDIGKVVMTPDASKYLRSYCKWQSEKKINTNKLYYSILLTGLDLFHKSAKGETVNGTIARSFQESMCSVHRSCTIAHWRNDSMHYVLAHEIGHSLGMVHDDPKKKKCTPMGIMSRRYKAREHVRRHWTRCNWDSLQDFLLSFKGKCMWPTLSST